MARNQLTRRLLFASLAVTFVFVGALLTIVMLGWTSRFRDQVTLPNGMVLVRSFDWSRSGRNDLLTTNGEDILARNIEGICFNDRYVLVQSYDWRSTGLYDAETNGPVRVDYAEAIRISGLSHGSGCDGYYTSWVGPGLLYDGNAAPFLPSCSSRNVENGALRDRKLFT
jgi:hypothetical protein